MLSDIKRSLKKRARKSEKNQRHYRETKFPQLSTKFTKSKSQRGKSFGKAAIVSLRDHLKCPGDLPHRFFRDVPLPVHEVFGQLDVYSVCLHVLFSLLVGLVKSFSSLLQVEEGQSSFQSIK